MNKSHLKLEFYLLLVPAAATLKCASGCGDVVNLLIIHAPLAEPQQAKVSVILDFFSFFFVHFSVVRYSQPLYFFFLPLDLKRVFCPSWVARSFYPSFSSTRNSPDLNKTNQTWAAPPPVCRLTVKNGTLLQVIGAIKGRKAWAEGRRGSCGAKVTR